MKAQNGRTGRAVAGLMRGRRSWAAWVVAFGLAIACIPTVIEGVTPGRLDAGDRPDSPPAMENPNFECSAGFDPQSGVNGLVPRGWTATLLDGEPTLNSARLEFTGSCGNDGFVEHIEGLDSLVFLAQDIETPPEPGKPFDAVIHQQVEVEPGHSYSLSGWMVSLCGGSFSNPNDCPANYYMAKMLGVDPTGGVDPLADTVLWDEDRRNFIESRWANLGLATTPISDTLTLFVRVRSPFRWHGNHAFADGISLVRAPTAYLEEIATPITDTQAFIAWQGDLGPDIPQIPGGTFQLAFDIQYRDAADGPWRDWLVNQPAGGAWFAMGSCSDEKTYEFRVRGRSEQLANVPGAWPPSRYLGEWSDPAAVTFVRTVPCTPRMHLPFILNEDAPGGGD